MTDAKADIDIKMESAVLPNSSDAAGFVFKMKGLEGEQRITMNTSALEGKIAAFKLINMISENMDKAFQPYCIPLLPIISDHMNYQYSKVVRKYSFKTFMNMLHAMGEPHNVQTFQSLVPTLLNMITKNLEREDLKELKTVLKYFFLFCKTLNETNTEHKNYLDAA